MSDTHADNHSNVEDVERKGETQMLEKSSQANGTSSRPVVDVAAEKRYLRKMDRNLIPLLAVMYLLSFLDRSNVGNAATAGMNAEIHLSSADYQWLLTIFYISYITFEWQTLMWKAWRPHKFAALMVLVWGLASTLQAVTQNWAGMMALRFILGAAEAGFGPAIPFFLSFFYLRHEVGFRIGMFLSAAPLASCFAGALAYGITHGQNMALSAWRVLFIVEGIPTVVMAVIVYFYLPDTPQHAKWLDEEDKEVARNRGVQQVGEGSHARIGHINWKEIIEALKDPKSFIMAFMYFSTNVGFSSLPVYLPTILTSMGFDAITSQGLSAPPYFLAFIAVISTTWIADRLQQRGLVLVCTSTCGAVGYIMLATAQSVGVRYAGAYFAAVGVFPSIMNILPWVINNQGSDTKRGTGIVILNLIGQCGPLLGTRLYPAEQGPQYSQGHWICAAFLILNAVLAFSQRTYLKYLNKKLDEKFGQRKTGDRLAASENDGANFRYVL